MKTIGPIASMILLVTYLSVVAFSSVGHAGAFVVFGPEDYIRSTKKPIGVTDSFSVLNPNTTYTLHVYNGGKNSQFRDRVSSAVIKLNGAEIVGPSEVSQQVSYIEKAINLSSNNELAVELRSGPGSRLTVEIVGVDNDPPTIVATQTPPPNGAGWNNTDVTVGFQCSDMTSGIASCSPPVLVQAEGGGQVVTGHATDRAGNTASASVTINLDKTPPSLTIASPADEAILESSSVNVMGNASDAISGIATVTCNGNPVALVNSAFSSDVLLVLGENPITVEATDVAGNPAHASITVTVIGDLPDLELAYVDSFEKVLGGSEASFWRPIVPAGFCALGHYCECTRGLYWGTSARAPTRGFMFAVRELTPGALAEPECYELINLASGGGIWRPVPPEGYVCLGLVAQGGSSEPSTDEVLCVREDLVVPGRVQRIRNLEEHGVFTWHIVPADENGIYTGTWTCEALPDTTSDDALFCLAARSIARYDLDSDDVHSLIRTQGPQLRLHSEEEYFLDDPEYVLDNAELLWAYVWEPRDFDKFEITVYGEVATTAAGLMQDFEDSVESDSRCPTLVWDISGCHCYLRIPQGVRRGDLARARVPVRVRPWNHLFTDVQFWFFYPYNGPGRVLMESSGIITTHIQLAYCGRHVGDWERVTLRFLNIGKKLVALHMSQHGGGEWVTRPDFKWRPLFDGEHPVIYPAKYSHANYTGERLYKYELAFSTGPDEFWLWDKTSRHGEWFEVYDPDNYWIASSEIPGCSAPEPDWLEFTGRWGQYLKSREWVVWPFYEREEVVGGPSGPARQTEWLEPRAHWWWSTGLKGRMFSRHASHATIAPPPPSGLMMTSATELAWNVGTNDNFEYFTVYGSAAPGLGSGAVPIGHTTGTGMDVTDDQYHYYHVTATNSAGNEGAASSVENTYAGGVVEKDPPLVFALKPNRPNPFESRTRIAFDLPEPCAVRLEVLDVRGRVVRVLTNEVWPAGRHSVIWTGESDSGEVAGPGVYFVRIEAGGFTATNKILLMR
jgi:hypothetical protein